MTDTLPEPPDLNISLEQLAYIVVKAREFDVKEEASDPDSGSDGPDDMEIDILQDGPDDPTAEELAGALGELNDDEQAEFLALLWIGRGDYEAAHWEEAVDEATARPTARFVSYCLAQPMLSDFIETGLQELGIDISDYENAHL